MKYKVTAKPIINDSDVGAFVGINCDHEFDHWDMDWNEVYIVHSDSNIDLQLDLSEKVISYEEITNE